MPSRARQVLSAVAPGAVAALLAACQTAAPALPPQEYTARELTLAEKRIIADAAADILKDPLSAQFRWMPLIQRSPNPVNVYCVLVNARNSFGGYVGFSISELGIELAQGRVIAATFIIGGAQMPMSAQAVRECGDAGYRESLAGAPEPAPPRAGPK